MIEDNDHIWGYSKRKEEEIMNNDGHYTKIKVSLNLSESA